jgi:hypothetical protein
MKLEQEILNIIEWYGRNVDSQGWQVPARFLAVKRIANILNKNRFFIFVKGFMLGSITFLAIYLLVLFLSVITNL